MGANSLLECGLDCGCGGDMLPHDPHCALNFHYGMLLGAEDLRVEQGFHVGRARRHNHSLHGAGVVWGMGVAHDAAKGEIAVAAGLAVDGQGRELVLELANCLSLPAWWQVHRQDPALADQAENDSVEFAAEVVACYSTCLSRPVPAIAQTCAGENSGTAYSRLCETVCLSLRVVKQDDAVVAGPAPARYHRLRLLLGLDATATNDQGQPVPADVDLLAQRDALAALPADQQSAAAQVLWHQAAVADALARDDTPPAAPVADADCLVLARLTGVKLTRTETGWQTDVAVIDNTARPVLLPTEALQDLYAALLPALAARQPAAAAQPQPALSRTAAPLDSAPGSGGPRVLADTVALAGTQITLDTDLPLHGASVKKEAFDVSEFSDRKGWSTLGLKTAKPSEDGKTVTLTLAETPSGAVLRLVARGSGDRPLLGTNLQPLAGANGSGTDFVYMISGDQP
jgi:hypothetical protein